MTTINNNLDLTQLPDDDYEDLIVNNAFTHTRDPDTWDQLLGPALSERTRTALTRILGRHISAARARNEAWETAKAEGHIPDFKARRAEYGRLHARDASFTGIIQQAIREANAANKRHNIAIDDTEKIRIRRTLHQLAAAIAHHQTHQQATGDYSDRDEALWTLLDTLEIPHHNTTITLRNLIT